MVRRDSNKPTQKHFGSIVPRSNRSFHASSRGFLHDQELLIVNAARSVVVHNSDHNCVLVAIVDYYIRANHSITGKGNHRVYSRVVSL